MTTLTPNRILQKGDEYKQNGTWEKVPKADWGLQITFTGYKEVRRPSEEPKTGLLAKIDKTLRETPETVRPTEAPKRAASPDPIKGAGKVKLILETDPTGLTISPTREADKIATPVAAESEPVASPAVARGAGERLPTVVSKRAHKSDTEIIRGIVLGRPLDKDQIGALERRKASSVQIDWPAKGSPECIWTGRNGTFKCRAINLHKIDGIIRIVPVGKRGAAKNALIEFPASEIPQLIDWLTTHNTKPKEITK